MHLLLQQHDFHQPRMVSKVALHATYLLRAFVQFHASDETTYIRPTTIMQSASTLASILTLPSSFPKQVQKRILSIAPPTAEVAPRQHGLTLALVPVLCLPTPSICVADMASSMPNQGPLSLTRSAFFSWDGTLCSST